MNQDRWNDLVQDLHAADVDRAVAAAQRLQAACTLEDVPRLVDLLKDDSFFVREAAGWPLSDLGATAALPDLLEALHRGFEDGHDNDSLSAALADLAEMHPEAAAVVLHQVLESSQFHLHEHAKWLLEFCEGQEDA
jgi:HEAT repeat protein